MSSLSSSDSPKIYNIAISGYGGRVNELITTFLPQVLKVKKIPFGTLNICAIVDDHFQEVVSSDKREKQLIKHARIYKEQDEEEIYRNHGYLDLVMICSRNDKHFNSICLAIKHQVNIFCEKPLVHNIEDAGKLMELMKTTRDTKKLFFQTGLVLRYSEIADKSKIVLGEIGELQKVYGCELLNLGHGGQIIMKNWRRSKRLSGGLGIEKCVHDYDMIFDFINKVFGIQIDNVDVKSTAKNTFWLAEREQEIMSKIDGDKDLSKCFHKWDTRVFERVYPTSFVVVGGGDVIPDNQNVQFNIQCKDGKIIPIEFDISTGDDCFRKTSERYYNFVGSNGVCKIDMADLKITLQLNNGWERIIELDNSNGGSHAGGDFHLMNNMVSLLMNPEQTNEIVSFDEAIRSTIIGCFAEKSVETGETYTYYS
jgi:predicted dehydrogenase